MGWRARGGRSKRTHLGGVPGEQGFPGDEGLAVPSMIRLPPKRAMERRRLRISPQCGQRPAATSSSTAA